MDEERCAACLTCVRVCPYDVPVVNVQGEAEIDIVKCKGCGTCAAECPARAIDLMHFRTSQLEAKIGALVEGCRMRGRETGVWLTRHRADLSRRSSHFVVSIERTVLRTWQVRCD